MDNKYNNLFSSVLDTSTETKIIQKRIIASLENVTHQWKGAPVPIFNNFNLTIEDNLSQCQFISIMGQSGCGKSTILNMFAGLVIPDKGKVKINEKELTPNQSIPMIFQHYSSYPWRNVLQNVMIPLELKHIDRKEAEARSIEMLKVVGLQDHITKYPNQLSGGQQQRVAIARSLVCNSDILLLDEATSGLDIRMKRELQDILIKLSYGVDKTFINVGHNIEENVYMSNRIIILTANPCAIYKVVDIDFAERNPSIRKTSRFHQYVDEIDTIMTKICK